MNIYKYAPPASPALTLETCTFERLMYKLITGLGKRGQVVSVELYRRDAKTPEPG